MLILTAILYSIYTQALNLEYSRKIDQLSSGIVSEKKRFMRNAVDRTIQLIESERELVTKDLRSEGLTEKQLDAITIDRITPRIRNLRLIGSGYIWVNRIVNYDGGDKYAVRQIHPNLPHTEGSWLSTETTDIRGNKPYLAELEGVKKDGELYFEYYFKKMNSDDIAHKMSFAKLYKPYDWVVATGVYLDDVDELIAQETDIMQASLSSQRQYSLYIALAAVLISTAFLVIFERQIARLIHSYEADIKHQTSKLLAEKEKTELALAEVKKLSGLLPICSNCKKIRDDTGYWNQIEYYIEKYSEASFSHGLCQECADELYKDEDWYS